MPKHGLLVSSEMIETAAPVSNSISSGLPSTLRATWMGLGRVSLNISLYYVCIKNRLIKVQLQPRWLILSIYTVENWKNVCVEKMMDQS